MHFTETAHAAASPGVVFTVATDFARLPATIPQIVAVEVLTDGPAGVGTRFAETRKVFGKESTETFTVTAFDPPAGGGAGGFTLEGESCGMRYLVRHEFAPDDAGGTRIALTMTSEPADGAGLLTRLTAPLAGALLGGSMRKAVRGISNGSPGPPRRPARRPPARGRPHPGTTEHPYRLPGGRG